MPMAGAPRTTMVRMASATASTVPQATQCSRDGKTRWSSRCSAPSRHSMAFTFSAANSRSRIPYPALMNKSRRL
ncbi:hypothetical protein PFLmoz3_03563 [Pseudomonas fluorescens]|uniref:Uncharacterized protein n=1 Tax=Pseudomonas fluorescens TaxID=294 RepID=A0A109LFR3_PSEFL|nr:hypothetical protein PFLmoz3_03563 [Pseudomonas fluorescens]